MRPLGTASGGSGAARAGFRGQVRLRGSPEPARRPSKADRLGRLARPDPGTAGSGGPDPGRRRRRQRPSPEPPAGSADHVSRTRPRLCQSCPDLSGKDRRLRGFAARRSGPAAPGGARHRPEAGARRVPKPPDRPAVRPPATCAGSTSRRRRPALSSPPRRTRRGTCGPASLCGPTPSAFGPRSTASPKSRCRYPSA